MSITLLTTITVSIVALAAITDIAATIMEPNAARAGTWATEMASTLEAEALTKAEDSMVGEDFTVVVEEVTSNRT